MGICNTPATFQRATNVTFQNFVNKTRLTQGMINFCVIVYMDGILVYSETYHGHAQHIEWTLGALRDGGFKIALEKSEFFLSEISFLGYVMTRGELRPDSRKVAAVKEAPVPTSLMQVRAFLGLASYYRRVRVRLTWTRDEEHRAWIEYLELLIVHAWRTEVEGDLLGFLFGSVRPAHRQLIVQELTIRLEQLVDDLPLDIVSQCDESPVPHILARTLTPYLQWSACLEELGSGNNLPSQRQYLDPREIIDLAFFQPQSASEGEEGEEEEEEEEEEEKEEEEEEEGKEEEDEEETRRKAVTVNTARESRARKKKKKMKIKSWRSPSGKALEKRRNEQTLRWRLPRRHEKEKRLRPERDSWNSQAERICQWPTIQLKTRSRPGLRMGTLLPRLRTHRPGGYEDDPPPPPPPPVH
ncbi:hypothetical protein CBR_g25831 [Chara braunii]|uniref:Reverse transcriptase domain-containing protein n=1 Tax=Chara braunii TaxID=69332 RepID=A0A388L6H0_CHABU|nr:hypothetical protein CBR_g25831 [Chara braunii]|eukprot:GBG77899.1 hypothetical protein CBR_g25831 [Chara braunii]